MKKYIGIPFLAAVLLFAGCAGPLDEGGAGNGSGVGTVRVLLGEGQARTLLPEAAALEGLYYALRFSAEGKAAVAPGLAQGTTSAEVELEPGTWSLEVKGYVSETEAENPANAVVTGGASVTLEAGKVTPVRVALNAKAESGAGTLVYDLRFPSTVESAVLVITPISGAGNRQERDLKAAALTEGNVSRARIEMDNLAAGYYRLSLDVSAYDSGESRALRARKTAIAHIYHGLATTAAETLGPEDFADIPVFTGIEALSAWLAAAAENTKDTPYKVALRGLAVETDFAEGSDPLGKLYAALNKYVDLDLSACTGEVIGDGTTAIVTARLNKDKLVSLVLSATLKTLGAYGFQNCTVLASLEWPSSAAQESIGNYAFSGCTSLASLKLPEKLETIGDYAFQNCSFLREISLPEGLTKIGNYAFQNCSSLRELSLLEGLTQIGNYAFQNCSSLRELSLPEGLTQIGTYAFQNCNSLREIPLPEGLQQIGNYAFSGCSSLRKVSLPEGLTQLGSCAFQNCSSLEEIFLPEGLTQIGTYIFSYCSSLREVSLPADLTQISQYMFEYCNSLEEIALPAGLEKIDNRAFQNCSSLREISLPAGLSQIGEYAFLSCRSLREISLPAGLMQIGNFAFQYCTALLWVKWPVSPANAGLGTNANGAAFNGCTQLEKVELPDNLKTIYNSSFSGCTALRVVILRRSASPLTALNNANAFPTANTNLKIYVPDAQVSDYQGGTNWSNAAYSGKIVSITTLDQADDPSNW